MLHFRRRPNELMRNDTFQDFGPFDERDCNLVGACFKSEVGTRSARRKANSSRANPRAKAHTMEITHALVKK